MREKIRNAAAAWSTRLAKKQVLIGALVVLVLLLLFHNFVKSLVSILALFAVGAFSTYYKRKLESFGAIGFEFVTFTAVLAGIAFGPVVGAIFGLITSLFSVVISRDVGATTVLFLAATAVAGAFAQRLSASIGVVWAGMFFLALSALAVQGFTFWLISDREIKILSVVGIFVNFFVNYLLLDYLARPILALIS